MNIKLITTALTLLVISTFGFSSAYADERFSLEEIACYVSDAIIVMVVPMPEGLDNTQREILSGRICDSIDEHTIPSTAVCDTDTNCMYYDEYKQFGVASVMVSHDDDKGMRWLSVTCNGDVESLEPRIIDDPSELGVVCN